MWTYAASASSFNSDCSGILAKLSDSVVAAIETMPTFCASFTGVTVAMVVFSSDWKQHHLEDVLRTRFDVTEDLVGGRLVQMNPRDGRLRAVEHDVLGLLHVDAGLLDAVEDGGEHADPIAMSHDQEMGRGRLLREVDDVRRPPRLAVFPDDPHRFGSDRLLRLVRRRADVVRPDDAGQLENRVLHRAGAARRLTGENVQAGADSALAHGALERRLIDDFGARRVDEERAGTHGAEEIFSDQFRRVRLQGDVDADHVCGGRDLEDRVPAFDAEAA